MHGLHFVKEGGFIMNNNTVMSRILRLYCALALCTSVARAQEPYIYEVFNFSADGIWQTLNENIRVPNMVISDQGTICVLLQDRDRKSDNADNKIVIKRSFDGGETWSAMEIAIDPVPLGFNTITPQAAIFLPANATKPDRLLVLFQDRVGALAYKTETTSDIDDSATPLVWATPIAMPHLKPASADSVVFGAGEGIVLRHGLNAGRIIFTGGHAYTGLPTEMCAFYSDDDGDTWAYGNYAPQPSNFQGSTEVSPTELPNGDILCVLRTGSSAIAKAQMTSTDGGINWTAPVRNGVSIDNAVNQGILAFSDPADGEISRILFSSPAVNLRNTGTVYLSYDEGANWSARKIIYPNTGEVSFIYSSIIRLIDGNIGVLWVDFIDSNVKFAKFSLDWLTDGADFVGNTTVPQHEAIQIGFENAEAADVDFVNAWGNWTETDAFGGVWTAVNSQTTALVPHEGVSSASLGNAGDSYLEYDPPGTNGVRSVTFWFRRSASGDTGTFKLEYDAGAGWQPTAFSVAGQQSNDYDVSGQPFVEINQSGDVKLRWSVTGHVGGRLSFDDIFIVPMDNTGPVNNPPAFAFDPFSEVNATEATAYSATIADDATDPDPGDALTFSKVWGPDWLSVAAGGSLSGTPGAADVGLNAFRVRAADPGAMFAEVTLNITVDNSNNPPAFSADPFSEVDAIDGIPYSSTIADDATDPDSDPLNFSAIAGPAWLSVASGGALSGAPGTVDVGLNSWMVQVDDGNGGSDSAALEITVNAYSPTALFSDDFGRTAGTVIGNGWIEDLGNSKIHAIASPANNLVINDAAIPYGIVNQLADTFVAGVTYELKWSVSRASSSNGTLHHDVAIGTWNGSVFTPLASQIGSISGLNKTIKPAGPTVYFTATATEAGQQIAIRCKASTGSSSFTGYDDIVVNSLATPVNNPPAFTADPFGKANAAEGTAYSASIAGDASDPESDPMTFSKVTGPAWLSVASDGTLSGTPGAGDVGLNVFTVQVDASGGSGTAVLNITVDAAGPLFTDDFQRTAGTTIGNGWIEDLNDSRIFDNGGKVAGKMVISVVKGQVFAIVNQLVDTYVDGKSYELQWNASRSASASGTLNYNVEIGTWNGTTFSSLASQTGSIAGLKSSVKIGGPVVNFTASSAEAGLPIAVRFETAAGSSNWVGFDDVLVIAE
jgi:hypothetical protein